MTTFILKGPFHDLSKINCTLSVKHTFDILANGCAIQKCTMKDKLKQIKSLVLTKKEVCRSRVIENACFIANRSTKNLSIANVDRNLFLTESRRMDEMKNGSALHL